MENQKYLYGASVQGIQSFIFQTNKLAEIVGASELVELICTTKFQDIAKISASDPNIILAAAGNIKYIFEDKRKCADFVRLFPKEIMNFAPGVTIRQAVVSYISDNGLPKAIETLEQKLRTQRNLISMPTEIGFMGLERARRTGGTAVKSDKEGTVDTATLEKSKAKNNKSLMWKISGNEKIMSHEFAFDIKDITKSGVNSWIAVIHADGNGLGNIIQNKGKELTENKEFNKFSNAIEKATKLAVQTAFKKIVPQPGTLQENKEEVKCYPIRPIIIGGDDLTVIIRADLALDFTNTFLIEFENESKKAFSGFKTNGLEGGLTSCAGIAYVKESYPLHYALHLAEELCTDAKKKVKKNLPSNEMPKSSLAFYKVQDSFVDDLKELKVRTLKTRKSNIDFYAGPYLLDELNHLKDRLSILKKEAEKPDKSKATGKLRQIVSEFYKDKSTAFFMMERMKEINPDFYKNLGLDKEKDNIKDNKPTQLLDLITLHSFNYGNNEN